MTIELGCLYEDRITGFRGVATGHVDYISGCNQVLLTPRIGDNQGQNEATWFDIQRVRRIDGVSRIVLDNGTTPGFDKAAPIR